MRTILVIAGAIVLALIVLLLTLLDTGVMARATAAPPDGLDPLADRPGVLAYARSLDFNDGEHGTADTTRLITQIDGSLAFGPLAVITPERGSYQNKEGALRRGRVVARIWLEDDYFKNDTLYYPAGTSYIWIDFTVPDDSLVPGAAQDSLIHPVTGVTVSRTYRNVGRWLIIPENPADSVIQHGVTFTKHARPDRLFPGLGWVATWYWNMALARWRGDPANDPGWTTCREHGCCAEE